ncbi:MAG: alpha-amylase [Spirochaetales bacterium]|jgi:glycosidase|nr:alpha-amylase [Spirochaetales bacterium]
MKSNSEFGRLLSFFASGKKTQDRAIRSNSSKNASGVFLRDFRFYPGCMDEQQSVRIATSPLRGPGAYSITLIAQQILHSLSLKRSLIRLSRLTPARSGVYAQSSFGPREFHISRAAREKYAFDESLYSLNGNVIFTNVSAVREFTAKVNEKRSASRYPERAMRAGHLHAMGLIDEILHYVAGLYRESFGAAVFTRAVKSLKAAFGAESFEAALLHFVKDFPPLAVHTGQVSPEEYLAGTSEGVANTEIALEEMLMLWLANDNPAFAPFGELFDDTEMRGCTNYLMLIGGLKDFFADEPKFGPKNHCLPDMLKEPVVASPYSLSGQLEYIREHWGLLLGSFLDRLLRGLDLIREEDKARGFATGGTSEVYTYSGEGYGDEEFERFSPDKDWMPKVVLLAKSTLVWLDQLSRKYGRPITTLDGIPDAELDSISGRGINGLWLIGLWERSAASKRIKELCGNQDAAASAYSLRDYSVAHELGGWAALTDLRRRAWKRGIRIASDMVPNHTGIDSTWMSEHPERFIQSPYPPFPGYTFTGENLFPNSDVGVFIEDHYYDRTDAAVVFKRVHWPSGDTRYIYHGNDGTHMPWNDTAQLNFLLPEVREAVIRTILHVARNFPIIRFDAAMTLAKRHFARLWYPEPGSGGDIPSRAERGLSRDEFNRLFPVEFWREVVDRVALECPDTLLLAEAFWMMEGYFVRTLGMHRVYNSAFMNMLKNEDNAKYRTTIKNTQEFDKDILKRFVNFMNNPDEETAIAQFGDSDKYFGVCTLMVTMPGLPMIGHGQIEGFREKYGMEYRRAYHAEEPNQGLIGRHEREIFPLLKKRYLFAEVAHFLLYDVYDEYGRVNENIFAYSNRSERESALVLYNNAYSCGWGWLRMSAAYGEKAGGAEKNLVQRSLADGLGLGWEGNRFCVFREQKSNSWFIRSCQELHEKGLFINLKGYETQVFLDIHEVIDDEAGSYRKLAESLGGSGTDSIAAALREMMYQPLYAAFRPLVYEWFPKLKKKLFAEAGTLFSASPEFEAALRAFVLRALEFRGLSGESEGKLTSLVLHRLACAGQWRRAFKAAVKARADSAGAKKGKLPHAAPEKTEAAKSSAEAGRDFLLAEEEPFTEEILFLYAVLQGAGDPPVLDDWALYAEAGKLFAASGADIGKAESLRLLLKILLNTDSWFEAVKKYESLAVRSRTALENLFASPDVQAYAGVNHYQGDVYFNREGFLSLVRNLVFVSLVKRGSAGKDFADAHLASLPELALLGRWITSHEKADYRLLKLFEHTGEDAFAKTAKPSSAGKSAQEPESASPAKSSAAPPAPKPIKPAAPKNAEPNAAKPRPPATVKPAPKPAAPKPAAPKSAAAKPEPKKAAPKLPAKPKPAPKEPGGSKPPAAPKPAKPPATAKPAPKPVKPRPAPAKPAAGPEKKPAPKKVDGGKK